MPRKSKSKRNKNNKKESKTTLTSTKESKKSSTEQNVSLSKGDEHQHTTTRTAAGDGAPKIEMKQVERPFPRREFIQSRVGTGIILIMIAVLCEYFFAKPILQQRGYTESQLFQEMMQAAGVNFENTLRYINASIPAGLDLNNKPRPGYILAQKGARAKNPVVLIPGFITSGLELWAGEECAKRHFRQKLWGSLPILFQSVFSDMKCWSRHLALDPLTGGDPKNIKVRSALGFEAADYFMSTYWVWDKIIENLADVGYDSSNMMMMSYDWRLSFAMLEVRDGYMTKLKANVEALVKTTGTPVVLVAHSMGSQIVLYFFKWVTTAEKHGGGGGGSDWVERHITTFVNIAGPLLGVAKAVPALLSGEMKDTAALLGPMGNMIERVFGKKDRKELWTTWGSLWEMLPKGGDAIWGMSHDVIKKDSLASEYHDPQSIDRLDLDKVCMDESCNAALDRKTTNDTPYREIPEGQLSFITFTNHLSGFNENESDVLVLEDGINNNVDGYKPSDKEWTITDTIKFLIKSGGGYGGSLHAPKSISPRPDSESWNNPLVTPLPYAPSMKMYCLYGVGIETERAYFYQKTVPSLDFLNGNGNDDEKSIPSEEYIPYILDSSVNDPAKHVHFGTRSSDGDISVPLISLGYMCVDRWKNSKKLNPSNIKVTTREYKHKEEFQVNDPMRGGPYSADHVDILGNVDSVTDLLKIITEFETGDLQDQIVSDIVAISQKISNRNA
jgi:phospholipid:diacylglycerol acyltransferase